MIEYKNTVDELSELKGWRKPEEELHYLQGALLGEIKGSRGATRFIFIIFLISVPLTISGVIGVIPIVLETINEKDVIGFMIAVVGLILLLLWGVFSIKMYISSLSASDKEK